MSPLTVAALRALMVTSGAPRAASARLAALRALMVTLAMPVADAPLQSRPGAR